MTLKDMRILKGLSQAELAALSGVNLRSLQDYEQGHKSIASAKGETLLRLSKALGFSIENLLEDSTIDLTFEAINTADAKERFLAYERHIASRKENIVHFPVIVKDTYVDMSRIYPTKQQMVGKVLSELRMDNRVTSLRLFGSSITMACNKDSDLDFAIGLNDLSTKAKNEVSEKVQLACDWSADIIWADRISSSDRIYTDIMKGLILI